jgi:hypothetical protein
MVERVRGGSTVETMTLAWDTDRPSGPLAFPDSHEGVPPLEEPPIERPVEPANEKHDWRDGFLAQLGVGFSAQAGGFWGGAKAGLSLCAFSPLALESPACAFIGGLAGVAAASALESEVMTGDVDLEHVGMSVGLSLIGAPVLKAVGLPLVIQKYGLKYTHVPALEVEEAAARVKMAFRRPGTEASVTKWATENWPTRLWTVGTRESISRVVASTLGFVHGTQHTHELYHRGHGPGATPSSPETPQSR